MSEEMVTETLSSYKTDTRVGNRGNIPKARKDLHGQFINGLGSSVDARHVQKNQGIAEKAVRRVKRQRWFNVAYPIKWWDFAMERCCYLSSVHDEMAVDRKMVSNSMAL